MFVSVKGGGGGCARLACLTMMWGLHGVLELQKEFFVPDRVVLVVENHGLCGAEFLKLPRRWRMLVRRESLQIVPHRVVLVVEHHGSCDVVVRGVSCRWRILVRRESVHFVPHRVV